MAKGVNNIGIESGACSWATPRDTWSGVSFPMNTKTKINSVYDRADALAENVYGLIQKLLENYKKRKAYNPQFTQRLVELSKLCSKEVTESALPHLQ